MGRRGGREQKRRGWDDRTEDRTEDEYGIREGKGRKDRTEEEKSIV
jgi:hypothetical protein